MVKGNYERGKNKSRNGSTVNLSLNPRRGRTYNGYKCVKMKCMKRDSLEKKKRIDEKKDSPSKFANIMEEDAESSDEDMLSDSSSSII